MDQNAETEQLTDSAPSASASKLASWCSATGESSTRNAPLIIGALCVLASVFLKWVNAPLGKDPRGLSFVLFDELPARLQPHVNSYGALALLLLAAGLVCWRWRPTLLRWVGIALLAVAMLAPMQLAFSTPASLRRLASEFHQYAQIRSFSAAYLPVNKGREPSLWLSIETDTVWERLASSWYFLSLGWCVFCIGAITIFATAVVRSPNRRARACVEMGVVLIVVAACSLWKPAKAQAELRNGYLAQARGENEPAIAHYRKAIRLDRWYALGPEIYARIGQLHDRLGKVGSPEHQLYQASLFEERNLHELAVFEYQAAQRAQEPIAGVARQEAARALVDFGIDMYEQQSYGAAARRWEQAIQEDPFQYQAYFYLTRAYFQLAQYANCVAIGEPFCRRVSNVFVVANTYSNLGDAYTQLQDFTRARECYTRSMKLDGNLNTRALQALVGD